MEILRFERSSRTDSYYHFLQNSLRAFACEPMLSRSSRTDSRALLSALPSPVCFLSLVGLETLNSTQNTKNEKKKKKKSSSKHAKKMPTNSCTKNNPSISLESYGHRKSTATLYRFKRGLLVNAFQTRFDFFDTKRKKKTKKNLIQKRAYAARAINETNDTEEHVLSRSSASTSEALSLSDEVRKEFPIIVNTKNEQGMAVIYLDSAATSQKPTKVLEAHSNFYRQSNANVHRAVHYLSAKATDEYERARAKVGQFVAARSDREIVFTRNASEAINLVANTFGEKFVREGDEIVLSVAEHHSNIVPWQLLCERKKAKIVFIKLNENEELDLEELEKVVNEKTKIVSLPHVSNVLGFTSDVEKIVKIAKKFDAKVVLDACQSVPHMPVNVQELGVDFLVASGHKMCGPSGIGFLWGKYELLEQMPPWMGGGEMIQDVYLEKSTYALPPGRFEAGTPAIAEAVALGAACDYLSAIGMDRVHRFELELGAYLYSELSKIKGVRIYGPKPETALGGGRAALCAFNVQNVNCQDICTLLDQLHAVGCRSGHHCTQPLHRYLDCSGSARASLYIYNDARDVDAFISALKDVLSFLGEDLSSPDVAFSASVAH